MSGQMRPPYLLETGVSAFPGVDLPRFQNKIEAQATNCGDRRFRVPRLTGYGTEVLNRWWVAPAAGHNL